MTQYARDPFIGQPGGYISRGPVESGFLFPALF